MTSPSHLPLTLRLALGALVLCASAAPALAQRGLPKPERGAPNVLPSQLEEVDVSEKLGSYIDKDLEFTDHRGERVKLGDYFDGETPVLVTLNWYNCETLCSTQLNQLLQTFKRFDWTTGEQFKTITLSFDPREGFDLAAAKRDNYLDSLGRGDVEWAFLTDSTGSTRRLADSLGFSYSYDAAQDLYAHTTVVFVLSGEGKISRYLYGISYEPQDLRFSLIEASEGRVGSLGEKLLLSCFKYDPEAGSYGAFAFGIMRLAGGLTIALIGVLYLAFYLRRKRRRSRTSLQEALS